MTARRMGALAAYLVAMTSGCLAAEPSGADHHAGTGDVGSALMVTCDGDACGGGGGGGGGDDGGGGGGGGGGDDGGGGGGDEGAPISPPDVTASYLDARARTYLASAGVPDTSSVGATMWVQGCKISSSEGAATLDSGITRTCVWANLLPGWIILETNYEILRNDHGRGTASVSSVNGSVTISESQFGAKFNAAIDLALSVGDIEASQKLELEYQRLHGYSFMFNGTGNNLVVSATANGGLFQGSYIEVEGQANLLRIY